MTEEVSSKVNYKELLKDKNFFKLFLAGIITRFGDAVDGIAFGFMVYEMTGSAVLIAALFAVNGIPSLVFSLISGVLVTYMPKKKVVYLCDFLRGAVVILTGVLYFTGGLEVWHLYVFTALNSTFEAFREPAAAVLFVNIMEKEKFEHGVSLNTSARTFFELLGYVAAGAIIGLLGVSGAIVVDGVTFIISGLLILVIKAGKEELKKEVLTIKKYFVELKEGFDYSFNLPFIRFLVLFTGITMMLFSPFNALQTPYVLDNMDLGAQGISVLSIAFMVAMIIGSLSIPYLTEKIGSRLVFIIGGVVVGLGYLSFSLIEVFAGTYAGYIALGAVSMLMGSTLTFIHVPIRIAVMKKVDKEMLPRVYSFTSILALAAVPVGAAIVGALVSFIEIRTMFFVTGVGMVVLFLSLLFVDVVGELDR